MADELSRRRILAGAGAIGALAVAGCRAAGEQRQQVAGAPLNGGQAPPHGEADGWRSFDELWPPRLDPTEVPPGGYSRASRAVLRLGQLWKEDPRYDDGKRRPTGRMLYGLLDDQFTLREVSATQAPGQLFPKESEADQQFRRLWAILRESAATWLVLGGITEPGEWRFAPPEQAGQAMMMVTSLQPQDGRERDGLTPSEKREIEQAVLTLDDDDLP